MAHKDPEERRASRRAYNAAHREEELARDAAYRAAHREERRAYGRAYRAAHREEELARSRAYYAAHREERRAYRAAHREEELAYRRAHRVSVGGEVITRTQLPEELRPLIRAISEARTEISNARRRNRDDFQGSDHGPGPHGRDGREHPAVA